MPNEMSFKDMLKAVANDLPETWSPRREQPEWDRDFSGRAEIHHQFSTGGDKARDWMAFALAFSSTLIDGYEGLDNVRQAGLSAIKTYVPKGQKQFD